MTTIKGKHDIIVLGALFCLLSKKYISVTTIMITYVFSYTIRLMANTTLLQTPQYSSFDENKTCTFCLLSYYNTNAK